MSLPVYEHIQVKSYSLTELGNLLTPDMNLRNPVSINLKELTLDQQREYVGLIENYFVSNQLSFSFPYPVYIISDHQSSITHMSVVKEQKELPRFFAQKESRMNVKESHLAGKNKLLQQEVKNADTDVNERALAEYGRTHRRVFELEEEVIFYRSLLNKLTKGRRVG